MSINDVKQLDVDSLLTIASLADRSREIVSTDPAVQKTARQVRELVIGLRIDRELKNDNARDLRWLSLLKTCIYTDNRAIHAYRKLVDLYFGWLKDATQAVPYLLYGLSLAPDDKKLQAYYCEICDYLSVEKLRVAYFYDNRIGHLCMEYMEYQLNASNHSNQFTVFISSEQPANRSLLKKFSQHIPVVQSNMLYDIHSSSELVNRIYIHPLIGEQACWHKPWHPKQSNLKDFFRLFNLDRETRPKLLEFSEKEVEYCENMLRNMGLPNGSKTPYVCLNARSNHYLFEHAKERNGLLTQEVADSLEFRNSTLSNYSKAIAYLIDQGIYVVTVGSHLYGDLQIESDQLIDYSNRYRDKCDAELMDMYILSFPKFFICNHSGITDLAALNKTPLLIVNTVPIQPPYHSRDMYIPKYIIDARTREKVPYRIFYEELADTQMLDGERLIFCPDGLELAERGFKYEENTAEDILEAVVDIYSKIVLKRAYSDDALSLISQHWGLMPREHWMSEVRVPIAPSFLKKHHRLFYH